MTTIIGEVGEVSASRQRSPWIRRSVMADDFAYPISDAGIRVANMRAPSVSVATVLFEPEGAGR